MAKNYGMGVGEGGPARALALTATGWLQRWNQLETHATSTVARTLQLLGSMMKTNSACGWRALLVLVLLAQQACGPEPAAPIEEVTLPFPSDLLTVEDSSTATGLRVQIPAGGSTLLDAAFAFDIWPESEIRSWIEESDGFSVNGPIFWIADGPPDAAALEASGDGTGDGATLFLLDLSSGQRVPITARHDHIDDETRGPVDVISVMPLRPLAPGRLHAVVVLDAINGGAGAGQAPLFQLLAGERELVPTNVYSRRVEAARRRARPLFDHLGASGISGDAVAQAFTFTTRSARSLLVDVRAHLRANPARVTWTGRYGPADFPDVPTGAPDLSAVESIVTGEIEAPDLRDATSGDLRLPPQEHGTLKVPVLLALPAAGSTPTRVVMLGHGHGGRRAHALYVAPALAARGMATIAIDHVGHGALDGTGSFISLWPRRFRGSLAQNVANWMRLTQALETTKSVQIAGVDRQLGELAYVGESLGGISGASLTALEPALRAAVLNVTGGRLATSLAGAYLAALSKDRLLLRLGLLHLVQNLLDPVDPATFAGLHVREAKQPRPVLMQNVVGDTLGYETVEALASALGASYVCPCPVEAEMPSLTRTAAPAAPPGLFYFGGGAKHGFLLSEGSLPAASAAVREQAARFLDGALGQGATIVDPGAPSR